jgi:hypothetical protein
MLHRQEKSYTTTNLFIIFLFLLAPFSSEVKFSFDSNSVLSVFFPSAQQPSFQIWLLSSAPVCLHLCQFLCIITNE